ncbi:hypothetical protein QC589_00445 [Halomonas elongata]|uniref:hypothetical protein n=1 Tax=Halomonas elongata TaxID=2746 RepID=UPI0033604244
MTDNKSLFQLKRFWLSIAVPVLTSFLVSFVILGNSDLSYRFDYIGVNNFLVIFKVPIGLLALVFPFVALAASSHRSEQTKKQISLSESQNSFANYFKHLEEFGKIVDDLKGSFCLRDFNHRELYSMLFPINSPSYVEFVCKGVGSREPSKIEMIVDSLNQKVSSLNERNGEEEVSMVEVEEFYSLLVGFSQEMRFFPDRHELSHRVLVPPFAGKYMLIFRESDPFLHYYAFKSYIEFVGSFGYDYSKLKRIKSDVRLNEVAADVVRKLEGPWEQDPHTGEMLEN